MVGHVDPYAELRNPPRAEQTMGMPVAKNRYWTVEDVWALPDTPGVRYEAIDGELFVTPAPSLLHQRAVRTITEQLQAYARQEGVGEVFSAPIDVVLDDGTIVQPDVLAFPVMSVDAMRASARERRLPLLAVEVLSHSTARYDRIVKRPRIQRSGFELWIVDLDGQVIERWAPTAERPEVCVASIAWQLPGAVSTLMIDLESLFITILADS